METKEELVNNVKEWIKLDNEINELKAKIKENNNNKKKLTQDLVNVMKTNEIDCFDINGGALVYKKNTTKKPINSKMLLGILKNYYKDEPTTAEYLTKHILDNREVQVKEIIKRRIDKT